MKENEEKIVFFFIFLCHSTRSHSDAAFSNVRLQPTVLSISTFVFPCKFPV